MARLGVELLPRLQDEAASDFEGVVLGEELPREVPPLITVVVGLEVAG